MMKRYREGEELKKRLKESGKKLGEIAAILRISKKKLKRQLRKDLLKGKFRRLFEEKEILIFKPAIIEMAEDMVDSIIKNIIYLKASDKVNSMLLCELAAKIKQTSYSTEVLQHEKKVSEEAGRLTDKYIKK